MKLFILLCLLACVVQAKHQYQYEDNDFAEFEEFDGEAQNVKQRKAPGHPSPPSDQEFTKPADTTNKPSLKEDDDEAIVEEETDEFSHLADEDEFIGFNNDRGPNSKTPKSKEPKINITKVPLHLRSNWDSFYLEIIMVIGLLAYFGNYVMGKNKNFKIATAWFDSQKSLLENNFALVGDDGKNEIEAHGLRKESENIYILWCSGRLLMEGMLVELVLLKRQDIVSVMTQMIRPSSDQLIVHVKLDEMDPFVFALATKKSASKVLKEMNDICTYCPEKKPGDKLNLGSQYVVYSELSEITASFVKDPKVLTVMNKFPGALEYMHFSDQFSGPKQPEETSPTTRPEVKKTLTFAFNFDGNSKTANDSFDSMGPLMQLVLYLTDKVARLKLSKEMKNRADKNRSKVEEAFLKASHVARAELAQQMREEKKREERERIMNLDDPEKQRKWEEREQKRQRKKKQPKMKAMKVKPM